MDSAITLTNASEVYRQAGLLDTAERYSLKAVEVYEDSKTDKHLIKDTILDNRALEYQAKAAHSRNYSNNPRSFNPKPGR